MLHHVHSAEFQPSPNVSIMVSVRGAVHVVGTEEAGTMHDPSLADSCNWLTIPEDDDGDWQNVATAHAGTFWYESSSASMLQETSPG
jgi:hypothetical protein